MDNTVKVEIKGSVRALHLNHGDRIIVSFRERNISRSQIAEVRQKLQAIFPLNEVIVLAGVHDVWVQPAGSDLPYRA